MQNRLANTLLAAAFLIAFVALFLFRSFDNNTLFSWAWVFAEVDAARIWVALAASVVAPLYVIALMYYAAEDLDAKQLQRYGAQAAYQSYRAATGTLRPGAGMAARARRSGSVY